MLTKTQRRESLLAVAVLALFCIAATVITKISQYPNTATLSNTDLFIVASGATNKNISYSQLRSLILANPLELSGGLRLSGQSKELTVEDGELKLDGESVGGGAWVNSSGTLSPLESVNTLKVADSEVKLLLGSFAGAEATLAGDTYLIGDNAGGSLNSDGTGIYTFGANGLFESTLTNSTRYVFAIGVDSLRSATLDHTPWVFAYGDTVLNGASLTQGGDIFAFGESALANCSLDSSSEIFAYGLNALAGATLTNSHNVYAFGNAAGQNLSGTYSDVGIFEFGNFKLRPNGQIVLAGQTNQMVFGATNDPPVSSSAPTKWISVQVQGESAVYRLPLYE